MCRDGGTRARQLLKITMGPFRVSTGDMQLHYLRLVNPPCDLDLLTS